MLANQNNHNASSQSNYNVLEEIDNFIAIYCMQHWLCLTEYWDKN